MAENGKMVSVGGRWKGTGQGIDGTGLIRSLQKNNCVIPVDE